MPIDRAATLRNAEKLLRQGKLDLAIAEYRRVVEDQPRDWNTANILGDLYVRAAQSDKAVEQFVRIADDLADEGFFSKAAALYKKALKIQPEHEHALLCAADMAARQGLLAAARAHLNALGERRRKTGDRRGVAEVAIRLAALDPADYDARFGAARARAELDDRQGALRNFVELSAELVEAGKHRQAIDALRAAAMLSPEDAGIRGRLFQLYLTVGDLREAGDVATTVAQFKAVAAELEASGQADEALAMLRQAARLDPSDTELKAQLAQRFVTRGDLAVAAEYLSPESADPQLLLNLAELHARGGRTDDALALARRLLERDSSRRDDVVRLGYSVADTSPDAAFQLVGLAADAAVDQSDWATAVATLQEFAGRVPNHVPALLRLVEVCVDGGLDPPALHTAQAQLADAYIAAGSAPEARFIAEDLVAREPWDQENIERFRRTLVLLGEPDPDAIIADRLSGQSPFAATDLSPGADEFPPLEDPRSSAQAPPVASPAVDQSSEPEPSTPATAATDLDAMFAELDSPLESPAQEILEVDLSIELDDLGKALRPAVPGGKVPPADLEQVFTHFRDEVARRDAFDAAETEYKRGLTLYSAGEIDRSLSPLQTAAREPRLRFAAASLVGRIYRDRGMAAQAIEWFERAAEAPAPTADEGHLLLYELADILEDAGETARALAICLELQAVAGDYRDVTARVARLARVQARG